MILVSLGNIVVVALKLLEEVFDLITGMRTWTSWNLNLLEPRTLGREVMLLILEEVLD